MAGQIGLSYDVSNYQTLFVHKTQLGRELSKITNSKVTVKSVGGKPSIVPLPNEPSSDLADTHLNNSFLECHFVTANGNDENCSWNWGETATSVKPNGHETNM